MTDHVDGVLVGVFVFLFLLVTVLGFAAARWRRAASLDSLDEWGLGGRGCGTVIAWFCTPAAWSASSRCRTRSWSTR